MPRHNAYRDGRVHVCIAQCPTCIFRPKNRMRLAPGRVADMVALATRNESAIVCHDTLDGDNAVCRGFFDRHPTQPLQVAERLGLIEFFTLPPKGIA
jgi:hypothetical protein